MCFTSLVRFPRVEDPLKSVRRPGTVLDDGRAQLSETNSAGEVCRGYSPVTLPDSPNLEVLLQKIKREHRESYGVRVDKVDHGWQ